MKCEDYQERLMDSARGLANGEAVEHARYCQKCSRVLRNQLALSAGLAAFAAGETLTQRAGMEALLVAHLKPERRGRRILWPALTLAAAAGAAVWMILIPAPKPVVQAPGVVAKAVVPAPTPPPVQVAPRRKRMRRPKAIVEPAQEAESQFIPIPYAAPLLPTERAEIVRVNLPASALANMGMRVLGADPGMRLNADLVLGENGLARAVRFVNASSMQ